MRALVERFGHVANIEEDTAVHKDFADFPSDAVIKPKQKGRAGAIYFVSSNERLGEALLLQMDAAMKQRADFSVIALIEEPDMRPLSRRKFQRAQNRDLAMPIFRGGRGGGARPDRAQARDQAARGLKRAGGSASYPRERGYAARNAFRTASGSRSITKR